MTYKANIELCILWEDELRLAAKMLHAMHDENDPEAYREKAVTALQACSTALYGLHDDGKVAVMLGASELHKRVRDSRSAAERESQEGK